MNKKQVAFFKVITVGLLVNAALIALTLLKQKIYWLGCGLSSPQTPWQKVVDGIHAYLHNMPKSNIFLTGFILAGIAFFTLSIIMED